VPDTGLRPARRQRANELADFVRRYRRLFILSGAGISTESGIPGYRDDEGQWQRSAPVQYLDFRRSEATRQRYWGRSLIGWPLVNRAVPNAAHHALRQLESLGRVQQLVTQNVDGLHQRAGSTAVIELHGNIRQVACLGCGTEYSRGSIQHRLEHENPGFRVDHSVPAPDGDADLEPCSFGAFRVPSCVRCGGILKPTVVFFGEPVPRDRVDAAAEALAQADAMLVIGSSLMVYSGYRFCEWAAGMHKPIVAINRGRTRADHLFAFKIESSCTDALTALLASGLEHNT
jgi:NAD-dependent SIR2 family protein deacetylase